MHSRRLLLSILSLIPLVTACNLLTPIIFFGEHKKKIMAEFDKLGGSRVALLVWVPPETLFDYQYVPLELSSAIYDKLTEEMNAQGSTIDIVDPRDVLDYVQQHPERKADPRGVGRHFDTDYVIYLEILEFQIREPDQPMFLRGRINTSVVVHDMLADPDMLGSFELTPVMTVHPASGPVLMNPTNSLVIRQETYQKFAEEVARKFYEYMVDM